MRLAQPQQPSRNHRRAKDDKAPCNNPHPLPPLQPASQSNGPGAGDDPLIRYPGSSTARNDAHYLYADRLGSIVQEVKRDGTVTAINSYDAYGIPGASSGINNQGRFRYTGQTWIPELGMYYYKARMYSPTLGRFMQTDPIGYSDGMNVQTYVGNDPVNGVDPLGLCRFELWGMVRRTYDQDGNEIGEPEILYTYAKQVSECESSGLLDKALFKELERHDTSYSKIRAVVRQNPDGYSDPTTVTICTIGGTAIPTGLATIYGANTTLAIYNRLKPAGPGTRIYGDGKGSRI
ncbi:hypothetical protein GCM10023115_24040 [Pontixanthobacter gangjinensis]|uniref:RHS repeat-associated core domain-containing protein n=1 Tax=Pontixanthobacter gangjinensis TaxID=1028742 RepID=UPI001F1C5373|nr:RHS repeat-associated core domain-containing protein [Pontixanthobacter gangjinensis]